MSETADVETVQGPACTRCRHLRRLHGVSTLSLDPCECCEPPKVAPADADEPEEEEVEEGCGYSYDHTERITYEDEDGKQYECTECGAEWFEAADD